MLIYLKVPQHFKKNYTITLAYHLVIFKFSCIPSQNKKQKKKQKKKKKKKTLVLHVNHSNLVYKQNKTKNKKKNSCVTCKSLKFGI